MGQAGLLQSWLGPLYTHILFLIPQGWLQDGLGVVPGMSPSPLQTEVSEDSCPTHLAGSFGGSPVGGWPFCSALEFIFLREVEDSSSLKLMLSPEGKKQLGRSEIQLLWANLLINH